MKYNFTTTIAISCHMLCNDVKIQKKKNVFSKNVMILNNNK